MISIIVPFHFTISISLVRVQSLRLLYVETRHGLKWWHSTESASLKIIWDTFVDNDSWAKVYRDNCVLNIRCQTHHKKGFLFHDSRTNERRFINEASDNKQILKYMTNSVSHVCGTDSWRYVNQSPSSAAEMRRRAGSALVQVMACRLFGAKPLPVAMLAYCQIDP